MPHVAYDEIAARLCVVGYADRFSGFAEDFMAIRNRVFRAAKNEIAENVNPFSLAQDYFYCRF